MVICSSINRVPITMLSRARDADLVRRVDLGLSVQQQPHGLAVAPVRSPTQGGDASLPASAQPRVLVAGHSLRWAGDPLDRVVLTLCGFDKTRWVTSRV